MADSVFGTSPASSYSSSPVSTVDTDFELYPMSNAGASSALLIPSYTSDSSTSAATTAASYGQMTPPTPVMNDMVGFAAAASVSANNIAPVSTADMSMLCHCPGVYPCIPKSTKPLSPFVSAFEPPEEDLIYEDQQQQQQQQHQNVESQSEQEENHERYQSYNDGYHHHRHQHSTSPYASPYTKEPVSPTTPTSSGKSMRADRRRSSSYTANGKSERTQHPLLDPSEVPEITDIHVCPVCQRRFTRPFNLRSHLMTHTTARPYPCDQCHWKFTRQHDLQRHKRAKHPNSVTPAPAPVKTLGDSKSLKAA
ncbi:hypothetical protein BGW41_004769 [Actinomortierella wolfii]|nr:hypothetical protein BGW41_004769 [Actinomortierella wolfii]